MNFNALILRRRREHALRQQGLAEACRSVLIRKEGAAESGAKCTLCLENRPEPGWRGQSGAVACRRCINQSAAILGKDKDLGWQRPRE